MAMVILEGFVLGQALLLSVNQEKVFLWVWSQQISLFCGWFESCLVYLRILLLGWYLVIYCASNCSLASPNIVRDTLCLHDLSNLIFSGLRTVLFCCFKSWKWIFKQCCSVFVGDNGNVFCIFYSFNQEKLSNWIQV